MKRWRLTRPAKNADRSLGQRGFTIIELMIALTVLAIILVLSAVTLIQLGRLYAKGNNAANTQNTARNILNDIASQIQLSADQPVILPVSGGLQTFCIGSQRYTFQLNKELDGPKYNTKHVLWRDTMGGSSGCTTYAPLNQPIPDQGLTTNGVEMLSHMMRLTNLSVAPASAGSGIFNISVTVAYGDEGTASDGSDDTVVITGGNTHCADGSGSEYCAVSTLSETVVRRLKD